jgi:hypothetical protein
MAPARAVGAKIVQIPEGDAESVLLEPNDGDVFPWALTDDGAEYPAHDGVASVWTRPDPPRAVHAEAMRQQGIRQVGEIDDNYLAPSRHNIFLRMSYTSEERRADEVKALAAMDAMVFTTVALRDIYWQAFKDHKLPMPEMHVCGNHLFLEDWPERVESHGPLRVGWMGSSSHLWDVNSIRNALMWARMLGCEPVTIGYDPANPDSAPTMPRAKKLTYLWKRVGATHVPWRQMSGTERLQLPLDIGLCPLRWDPFTAGKSDIKAVEYTISGAAVIAQNHPVYNKNWKHMETAILCSSEEDFCKAVLLLAKNDRLREELVANAQQYVREERDLAKHADEWRAAVYG